VHVERKAVGPWVLAWVGIADAAIFGPHGEADTTGKDFVEHVSISQHDPVLAINIELGPWDFLAQLEFFSVHVVDFYLVGLVATSPDHQVRLLDVGPLELRSLGLDETDSSLGAVSHRKVKLFGVASKAREGVDIAILLLLSLRDVELRITYSFRFLHCLKEDFQAVPVEDFYVTVSELRQDQGVFS